MQRFYYVLHRSSHRMCSAKIGPFKYFAKLTGKHMPRSVFFLNLQTQLFSCEICEIFKNNVSKEHLRATVSDHTEALNYFCCNISWIYHICDTETLHGYKSCGNGNTNGYVNKNTEKHVLSSPE